MSALFKLSAIGIVIAGISSGAFASTGVFLGGHGLYIQPNNGDMDYASLSPISVSPLLPSRASETYDIDNHYKWDFDVIGGMRFGDHDDVTIGWTSQHTSDSDSISPITNQISAPRWALVSDWANITGRNSYRLDDVYAELGHTITFNNPWSLRLAAGVNYAYLKSKMGVTSTFDDESDEIYGYIDRSNFKGFGPRGTMGLSYDLSHGFALFGGSSLALLVSDRRVDLESLDLNDGKCPAVQFAKRHVVVPKVSANLGVSYTHVFCQSGGTAVGGRDTTLKIDAGWEGASYIHGVERVLGSGAGGFGQINTKVSNYAYQGAFIGLTLGYDWS